MIQINWTDTEGNPQPITAQQLADWWAINPDEEALETEIINFIKAQHTHPERYYFVLYEYSPDLDRVFYEDIESEIPLTDDWYIRKATGESIYG